MNVSEILERFGDLPFTLELELGALTMPIREIFDLREGKILRTEHPAGAPLGLFAGGVQLADAEVVIVDNSVSVRIQKMCPNPKGSAAGDDGTS